MTLEPYQVEAANWIAQRKRGIVVAPAGSGKTLIAAAALNDIVTSIERYGQLVRVGWMTNTIEQSAQAHDAVKQFPQMVNCINFKVACAAAERDWSDRDFLIIDEVHHSPSPQWHAQIETCSFARWGFTATPESEDEERNVVLRELFGNEVFTVKRDAVASRLAKASYMMLNATDSNLRGVIDAQIEQQIDDAERRYGRWLANEQRVLIINRYPRISDDITEDDEREIERMVANAVHAILWQRISFQVCIELGIVGNLARNEAVIETARIHRDDSVLILVNQIEHGAQLSERIKGAAMCHSKMGAKKRRDTLAEFKVGALKCIVATSLADEGLDLPIANVLILVSGGRSKAKTEQRTGRVLRTFAGKTSAKIYDFEDHFHPLARKHSMARQQLYEKLGYTKLNK